MQKEECQKIIEENPFMKSLQIELLDVSEGFVQAKIPFRKELTNVYGDFHGGALYAAADTLCGIAASTYGYYVTTVDGNIQYLKAGRNTEYILCECRVLKPGRNLSAVEARIIDDKGMLLNTAMFTFYNLGKRDSE